MATESRARGHVESSGASPTVWAIFFSSLAISVALVIEGSVRLEPNWQRWWAAILGLEISAYTLTLFLPPFARVNLVHALCRLAVGMLMRLFVVALCALLLVLGGESDLIGGLKLFWAAHWPAAIGEIACVAGAVYCFRVIAMRRGVAHREPPVQVVPPPAVTRSHDELLEELMADRSGGEAAAPAGVATAEPVPAEPQPSLPLTGEQTGEVPGPPVPPPSITEQPDAAEHEGLTPAVEAPTFQEPVGLPETPPPLPVTQPAEAGLAPPLTVEMETGITPEQELEQPPPARPEPAPMATVEAPPAELLQPPPVLEALQQPPPEVAPPPVISPPQPPPVPPADEPETVADLAPQPLAREPLPTAPTLEKPAAEQPMEPPELVETEAPPTSDASTAELVEEPVPPAAVAPAEAAPAGPTEDEAQPEAPIADPAMGSALKLPGEALLNLLPAELLNRPVEGVVERLPDGSFSFDWETIAPQLDRGEVRVPAETLLSQMPREVLASSAGEFLNALPSEGIELPLPEIIARLPAAFFAAPPDQAALEPLTDEPPIFREDGDPARIEPTVAEAEVVEAPSTPPVPTVDTHKEPAPGERPDVAPAPQETPEAAPPADLSAGEPGAATDEQSSEPTSDELLPEPQVPPRLAVDTQPPGPIDLPEQEALTETMPPSMQPPPERDEEQVISSAIAALQKKAAAEEEDEAEDEGSAEAVSADPAALSSEAEAPDAAHIPETPQTAAEPEFRGPDPSPPDQPPPGPEQRAGQVREEVPPEQVSYDDHRPIPDEPQAPPAEPVSVLAAEPTAAEQTQQTPEEAAPEARPTPQRVPIDAGIEEELRAVLRSVDCRAIELVSANGISVVVAHSSSDISTEEADKLAELFRSTRRIVAQTGAGTFSSALLIGTQANTFVGSPDNPQAPHLVVATNSASAGQATVAARKAMTILGSVQLADAGPSEEASGGPPEGRPAEDEELQRIAGIVGQRAAAFRSSDGFGVVAFGLETDPTPEAAAASEAVWKAAQRAQPLGVDRVLVMGSTRTLGLAMAGKAGALVVAGFAPGMNPGLVGTETAKIVRMCDDSAEKGGAPADVG